MNYLLPSKMSVFTWKIGIMICLLVGCFFFLFVCVLLVCVCLPTQLSVAALQCVSECLSVPVSVPVSVCLSVCLPAKTPVREDAEGRARPLRVESLRMNN